MRTIQFALALLVVAVAANAQEPKNLKVLQGFSNARLIPVMKGFTRALGVRCTYCHVGEEGKPLNTYDFASDKNPNKDRARGMLRMLGSINEQLKAIPSSSETRVNMWCHTCHAGRPRPMTLDEEMGTVFRASGVQAAIARYLELKEKYYGKAGYDFSERTLAAIGTDLLREGKSDAAIAIFRLNTKEHPASTEVWDNLAEAYLKVGKPQLASVFYRKALEIEPENENAIGKLKEIEGMRVP